jgi:hypothetical protein
MSAITLLLGVIIGGSAMTALQKAMANLYARQIHAGTKTLDDVKPQTAEYRAYVTAVYHKLYPNEEL